MLFFLLTENQGMFILLGSKKTIYWSSSRNWSSILNFTNASSVLQVANKNFSD